MISIGDRVCWDDEDSCDPERVGTVVEPTVAELAYVTTWVSSARAEIHGHVLVQWDGDADWDRGWSDPEDLQLVAE